MERVAALPTFGLSRRQVLQVGTSCLLLGGCESRSSSARWPTKVARIGYLAHDSGPAGNPYVGAFQQGLHELGLIAGRNIVMEYRFAAGKVERLTDLAAELGRLKVDVIVASQDQATHVARTLTSTIPIVMVATSDPVGTGLITSLVHPGGSITGLTRMSAELSAKRLELLRDVLPGVSHVAVLWNSTSPDKAREFSETQSVAQEWGMQLQSLTVGHVDEFWAAFRAATAARTEALITLLDHVTFVHRELVGFLASQSRLPTIFEVRECVEVDGLMAYGPSSLALYQRAAAYVYKLLPSLQEHSAEWGGCLSRGKIPRGEVAEDLLQRRVLPQRVRALHDHRGCRAWAGWGCYRSRGGSAAHPGCRVAHQGRRGRVRLRCGRTRAPHRPPRYQPRLAEDGPVIAIPHPGGTCGSGSFRGGAAGDHHRA